MDSEKDSPCSGCDCICAHLSEYLDDELEGAALAAMQVHLSGCAECRRYASELAAIICELHRLGCGAPE